MLLWKGSLSERALEPQIYNFAANPSLSWDLFPCTFGKGTNLWFRSMCGDMLSQSMVGVSKKEMEPWFNKQSINVPMSIHPDPGFVPMWCFPKDENGLVLWTASMEQFALNSHLLVFPCFWASQKANTTMAELPLWLQLSKRQEMETYLCYYFVWHICLRRELSILNRWPIILADLRTRQGEGVYH